MTEFQLVKTVIALSNFQPPDGVDYLVVLAPKPGDCRVAAAFSVGGGFVHNVQIETVPTEPAMMSLYRLAESLLATHDCPAGEGGPRWASDLGLDLKGIGGDQ